MKIEEQNSSTRNNYDFPEVQPYLLELLSSFLEL